VQTLSYENLPFVWRDNDPLTFLLQLDERRIDISGYKLHSGQFGPESCMLQIKSNLFFLAKSCYLAETRDNSLMMQRRSETSKSQSKKLFEERYRIPIANRLIVLIRPRSRSFEGDIGVAGG